MLLRTHLGQVGGAELGGVHGHDGLERVELTHAAPHPNIYDRAYEGRDNARTAVLEGG